MPRWWAPIPRQRVKSSCLRVQPLLCFEGQLHEVSQMVEVAHVRTRAAWEKPLLKEVLKEAESQNKATLMQLAQQELARLPSAELTAMRELLKRNSQAALQGFLA